MKLSLPIKTERLIIRRIVENDLNSIYSLLSNQDVMRYSLHGIYSMEETKEWISSLINYYKNNLFGMFAIVEKNKNLLIGICGLIPLEKDENRYEIAYRILPEFQGKGYVTEAVTIVKNYAIKREICEFFALIEEENKPSIRIAEKIGMKFLKNDIYKNKKVLLYKYG